MNDHDRYKNMISQQNSRAKRMGLGVVSLEEWTLVLERYGRKCLRCGMKELESVTGRLTMDHVVSFTHGGKHEIENLQPMCLWCNKGKQARDFDYRPESYGHATADGRRWVYESGVMKVTWRAEWGRNTRGGLA